jgi:hypothetical protein
MSPKAIESYISSLEAKFKTGQAREHTYRPVLEQYISALGIKAFPLNEPKHSEHGAPDFVFTRGDLILGYAETKDIGADLDKVEKSEQMERYLGYSNLILTDYLEFRFYKNGVRYSEPVRIASLVYDHIEPNQGSYDELENALKDFLASPPERIKSGRRLAEIMGGKARRIRDNVLRFLADKADTDTELLRIYESVKKMLVHDLTPEAFADMYAQTLVYGLFVARYHDESKDDFSRAEARDLVPESNPFLRQFFNHIAGPDFNKRLRYIVDELCAVLACADVRELMEEYFKLDLWGKEHGGPDPVIHFYEDFLKEYDAELRKKMGAYYTPLPVVRFIVRAVDHVLKTDFGLADGLADTSKLPDGRHKVQVLDPAVGTGTFISAVIRLIYERLIEQGQKGRWPAYVHHDLLPRIHGFELMMAAYTIAHLKLSIAFKQTGFTIFNKRLGIYLTNSLEQAGPQTDLLSLGFAQSIAEEAKEAAVIKNETPIMVVLGNPPYSVSSSNKGEWIQNLIKDYKKGLGEKKINLDDDYIKFIRFAEHFIEKNESGIVAMITNNSYIDGITHRQMRKHLLEMFNDIYILDLHGNSKKKEKAPDGGKDENVFNIQQGVAISIFVRKEGAKKGLGAVHHAELYGTRESKFTTLDTSNADSVKWKTLKYVEPSYFFVPKDFGLDEEYKKGLEISELFPVSNSGVKTDRDSLFIDMDRRVLMERIERLLSGNYDEKFKQQFRILDSSGYKLSERLRGKTFDEKYIQPVQYRPFDYQWIYYDPSIISRPADKVMSHIVNRSNAALIVARQFGGGKHFICFATKIVSEISSQPYAPYTLFPIYIYEDDGTKVSNLNKEIVASIEKTVGNTTPEDIFDYIYAVLHSPSYREKYKEFLKIDFPRVPYPKDKKQFSSLAMLGKELRELHLLESPKVRKFITSYPESGSNVVEKIAYKDGKVYINAEQYFGGVPEVAWNFYIGGYQPAQKWLKDRKGRTLTNEDIEHYQKIIVALVETKRIMTEIG